MRKALNPWKKISYFNYAVGGGGGAFAPFQTVNADGWSVAASDPVAAIDQTVSVTRQGFNAAGSAASAMDTVKAMAQIRLPYPDQAALTVDQVALSDFIYAGDTISGVTNNSGFYGPTGWTGEIAGDGEFAQASAPWPDMAWADDRSNLGSSTGGGDYTPGPGTAVLSLPVGLAPYSVDIYNRPVPNDGSGFVGAVQSP